MKTVNENELRLGNYLLYKGWVDEIFQVQFIDKPAKGILKGKVVLGKDKLYGVPLHDCFPILLTPKIMEKVKNFSVYHLSEDKTIFKVRGRNRESAVITFYKEAGIQVKIKGFVTRGELSLHSLQNLYYSLFGEELIVDL